MLSLYTYRAVGNGLRTDHPIPDLPFVDDSHIPLDDPAAIEALGRHEGGETWGREDQLRRFGGWVAFTTDPLRHDLAWCVRWHPDHGRSVVLYRDDEAASAYMAFQDAALLYRVGGYWWDGTTWYRPVQVWDGASEEYYRRPAAAAATVTAEALLEADDGDPARGRVLKVSEVDPDAPAPGRWLDDLAHWAHYRNGGRSLGDCVVSLTAPELTAGQLVGAAEMARIGGIAASTLRAYMARGEADVPLPQAMLSGRSAWSQPVAEDWAQQRQRSADGVTAAISTEYAGTSIPPGVAEIWQRFTRTFFAYLWSRPAVRRRWAQRWRTEKAVHDIAEGLGWEAAATTGSLIPAYDLGTTVRHAVLDEFATGQQLHHQTGDKTLRLADSTDQDDAVFFGIAPPVTHILDWLIRHHPDSARHTIGDIIGEAERRLGIPREVSEQSLGTALALDSKLDETTREEFLSRVLSPDA